ncbi:hypothetical protein [Actinocrinis sp.]|uniref:hypothetical protein n=1 Tax=Actinocrinis sp. TaxID=1920516 RepID=UPI002D415FB4|nr:hypothetical protein [Actinocrinis sp.]HZP50009.1 hypothetical protein [Actinocrinis sp.]
MRTMLTVELDTEVANKQIGDGSMGKAVEEVLSTLKPEAAYFYPHNGHRAMLLVVDLPDEASIVSTCEPFWLQLGAHVELVPCMSADDLRSGLSHLG